MTVLIATYFRLPVSSNHIAIGALFGVGFLREFLEAPKRKNKARYLFISGQLFESYFLTPKLVGEAIKLNPIWIIFALMTGAYLSGFVGILISLPIAAIAGVVVRHYFTKLF